MPLSTQLRDRALGRTSLVPLVVLVFVLLAPCASTAQGSKQLVLGDGSGPIRSLPVGDDLWVEASSLPASHPVDLVLRDDAGNELVRRQLQTSNQGTIPQTRLWARTGIRGCGCGELVDGHEAYPFVWPAEATVLVGRTFRVTTESHQGQTFASRLVPIVARQEPLLYAADIMGCPVQLRATDEAILFVADRPLGGPSRLFVTSHQPAWIVGNPLVDARPAYPLGQLITDTGAPSEIMIHPGILEAGEYDLIWRPNGSSDPTLASTDRVVRLPDIETLNDDRSDGGLVIDDWGCGRPN